MAECYLCYERNSPDIAERLVDCDNYDGSITGYRIMSRFENALAWLMSSIMTGIDADYHIDKTDVRFNDFDINALRNELRLGNKFTVTMYEESDLDDDDNTCWYDIVIETKELE